MHPAVNEHANHLQMLLHLCMAAGSSCIQMSRGSQQSRGRYVILACRAQHDHGALVDDAKAMPSFCTAAGHEAANHFYGSSQPCQLGCGSSKYVHAHASAHRTMVEQANSTDGHAEVGKE